MDLQANAALLIVYMQKGMTHPKLGRRNNPDAERRMEALLCAWRLLRKPIVHIRHISRSAESVLWPGQAGCEFQEALAPRSDEQTIKKSVPDAFVHTGLEVWLHNRSIRQLIVIGGITNNSVEATARSGGNLGFDVIVAQDAVYTFDQTDLDGRVWSAENVHVLSLSNLAMDYARVMEVAEILALVDQR
jgi:nicotinamidase-related amidase